jgi:hypothetical protein
MDVAAQNLGRAWQSGQFEFGCATLKDGTRIGAARGKEVLAAQLLRSSMGIGRSAQQSHPRDVRRRTRVMADVMHQETT